MSSVISRQAMSQPDTELGYNNNISSILESSVPSFRKTRPSAMDFLTILTYVELGWWMVVDVRTCQHNSPGKTLCL